MAEDKPGRTLDDDEPGRAPATDPTNPYAQESTGAFDAAERTAERKEKEPGLTEKDRQRRTPTC